MAIKPSVNYPGQVDVDPAYPYGKARNQTVENDGTGTPWEQDLTNDIFGFQQALLVEGRVSPSGVPDKVGASDYLKALKQMFQPLRVLTWDQPQLLGSNIFPIDAASAEFVDFSPNLVPGSTNTDKLLATGDGGATWGEFILASPTGVIMSCAAANPNGTTAIATGIKAGGTQIQYTNALNAIDDLGVWSPTSPPGLPIDLRRALFDPVHARFIVAGKTATAPYIATCEEADLATWTHRTLPGSITGTGSAMSLVQIGSVIVASWPVQTKLAYSTDGGATWNASTTTLASGSYVVVAGDTGFLAFNSTGIQVYYSTDGATWTAKPDFAHGTLPIDYWSAKFLGGVFIMHPEGATFFYYSLDYGATWKSFQNENRPWWYMGVLRNRLLNFRAVPTGGGNYDVYLDRSLMIDLP